MKLPQFGVLTVFALCITGCSIMGDAEIGFTIPDQFITDDCIMAKRVNSDFSESYKCYYCEGDTCGDEHKTLNLHADSTEEKLLYQHVTSQNIQLCRGCTADDMVRSSGTYWEVLKPEKPVLSQVRQKIGCKQGKREQCIFDVQSIFESGSFLPGTSYSNAQLGFSIAALEGLHMTESVWGDNRVVVQFSDNANVYYSVYVNQRPSEIMHNVFPIDEAENIGILGGKKAGVYQGENGVFADAGVSEELGPYVIYHTKNEDVDYFLVFKHGDSLSLKEHTIVDSFTFIDFK